MQNRRESRPNRFPALTVLVLAAACVACGTDGPPDDPAGASDRPDDSTPEAPGREQVPGGELDTSVVLEASLREWTERRIVVDYTLRNDADTDLVVLDVSRALQIERLEDGRVRLFKGKQDTGLTDFYEAPTIEGRALAPGDSVHGSGTRAVPLMLDYAFDRSVDIATDAVELCIGHGRTSELVPTRRDDGLYSLNEDLALQRLACTTLERASAPGTDGTSPLGDGDWERTLERVLETVGGEVRDVVLEAASALRLPEASSGAVEEVEVIYFTLADGTPGTLTRASCGGGGGFELVQTSGDVERVSVEAAGCTLGGRRTDGRVVRTSTGRASFEETTSVMLDDFIVDDGTRRVRVAAGVHTREGGHPTSTSAWSGTSYRLEQGGEVRTVTDLELEDVSIFGSAFDRTLSTSFTVTASWTSHRPLAVTTPRPFGGLTTSETGDFTRGALVLETEDGERLTLEADSGQPGFVLITLERGAAVTSLLRPWPEALRR